MSDAPGQATYPFVEMRDKVVPDLPDNSGKEHLSIVNCGRDVSGGRSTMEESMEGHKETFQGMMEIDGEQTQCAVAKSRANSTSDNEVDLWMKVCEQGYPSILRLHYYFLATRPMIAMELVWTRFSLALPWLAPRRRPPLTWNTTISSMLQDTEI